MAEDAEVSNSVKSGRQSVHGKSSSKLDSEVRTSSKHG